MIDLLSAIARRHPWTRQERGGWNKEPQWAVVLLGLIGLQERGHNRPASAGAVVLIKQSCSPPPPPMSYNRPASAEAVVLPGLISLPQERGYQVTGTDRVEARCHPWARQHQE